MFVPLLINRPIAHWTYLKNGVYCVPGKRESDGIPNI